VFTFVLAAGSLSAQAPPVPEAYQDLYTSLNTQITAFNQALKSAGWSASSSKYPYVNAPQLQAANSDQYTQLLGTNYYTSFVTEELQEMQALGATGVTVHINFPILYQPFYTSTGNPALYQQFVAFYQQLAQDVHARGMKLVVETSLGVPSPVTNFAAYQAYLGTLDWSEYMAGRAANALAVAQLIEPDYMTVMTEPDTEAGVSGQANLNTLTGVTQIVQQILATLQTAGVTNVQIGAGAGTWLAGYTQYVQAFAAMPMNFVDMHIYPINNNDFTNALLAANIVHAAGKQLAMSECWEWKIRDSEIGGSLTSTMVDARNPFNFWQPVDTSFLQSIVHFANFDQLAFVGPFWTDYFFAYLDYNTYSPVNYETLLVDAQSAAGANVQTGTFTLTGHKWETQNIPPDTTPPATPAAPIASVIGITGLQLEWTPDTDNVGVSAYKVYRDGTLIGTTSGLFYHDTGLVSGETYHYKLGAVDASGNASPLSAALVVETVDTTPPSVPQNLTITNVTATSITLTWNLSTGIGGVGGYRVLQGFSPGSLSVHANVTGPPYTDTVRPSTTYYFQVESYNPLGYTSGPSNQVSVTTPAP